MQREPVDDRTSPAPELVAVVKRVHAQLRDVMNGGKPVDELWREHVTNRGVLRAYSKAMRILATGQWAGREDGDRISWCVQTCEEYWSHRLEQLILKDLRRLSHNMPTLVQPPLLPTSQRAVTEMVDRLRSRLWRLLDVGSCYNPFLSLPQFVVTAIDIAPASEDVLECDFLNVKIGTESVDEVQQCSAIAPTGTGPCVDCVPTSASEASENVYVSEEQRVSSTNQLLGDYYDVVVFSLLLSYLPCTVQRLTCCVNAHRVLQPHGLLLVVTPDSSHQNKHAALMRDWRNCVEAVGFHRWKYEKLAHLHCMAFRKTKHTRREYSDVMSHHALLAIAQDRR